MNVLAPLQITDAMLTTASVPEPAAGEAEWTSGAAYAVDDVRIRKTTHRIYRCVKAVAAGRATLPEADPTYWLDIGPTLKWAAFDSVVSTQSTGTTSISFTLVPGFFNALALYGLNGSALTVTVKDQAGGSVVTTRTITLQEPPIDWYDWAFGAIKPLTKFLIKDLVPYPAAELTITVTAPAGTSVGIGMVAVGDLIPLADTALRFGGLQAGASAEPVTFSYIKTDDYGNTAIVRRRASTDLRFKVLMPREQADYALSVVQRVLDVPCAWIATDQPGAQGLNVFGLGSGSMSYDTDGVATFTGYVKGMT